MEKNQINKKGEVTTDNIEIQRIVREYYDQLYANKMDSLEEMDRSLGKFKLPRLKQKEIQSLNKLITNTEVETVIEISRKTKT